VKRPSCMVLLLASVTGLACDVSMSTQHATAASSLPLIELFVPAAGRRIGATLPIQLSVSEAGDADAGATSETCVALWGSPGLARFVFPRTCAPLTTAPVAADAGGPSDARTCVTLRSNGDEVSGSALAAYTPAGDETIVTLFGGVFADRSCQGPTVASVAVVIDLSPPPPATSGDSVDAEVPATEDDATIEVAAADDVAANDDGGPEADAGASSRP
jgi:hypothetical protein